LRIAPRVVDLSVILSAAKNPDSRPKKTFLNPLILACCVLAAFVLFSSPVLAFYKWEGNEATIELNGMLQTYGIAYKNPDNPILFQDSSQTGLGGIGRVILKAQKGDMLTFDINAYQTCISQSIAENKAATGPAMPDVERSSVLEWSHSNNSYVHTAIDRLSLRWTKDRVDIIAGRQPINLTTTFYFTPNDFFAPFAAQTFYRVYKPGVDALRAEVRLGELSQLSLISVLGYDPDQDSSNGWSKRPISNRASCLGRISTNMYNFEWALIAGSLADEDVIGVSAQGEVFKWLGVRAEGHVNKPEAPAQGSHVEYSVGIEHRWESGLDARIEYFHHGAGATSVLGYAGLAAAKTQQTSYLGRRYAALGIGYEFTPLLTGQTVIITNLVDHSALASLNAVYSLSNESELSLSVGVPFGKKPEMFRIRSEYGTYPSSLDIEWRWYF
jgi:hypothetical protein